MSERFWWPENTTQISEYVRSCGVCQRSNRSREQVRAPMQSVPIGGPFEMLHGNGLRWLREATSTYW